MFYFPLCAVSQNVGPAVSMYIYLRNKLCVNGLSLLTSGFSTINTNNPNPRPQVREKGVRVL